MDKIFLIGQKEKIEEPVIVFEKLQQVKKMIAQLVVCWTIIISKLIIR